MAIVTVSNLDLQVLMRLEEGNVLNNEEKTIGHYQENRLLNLQGQVLGTAILGEFQNGQGQLLLTISDAGEILSVTGSVVGYVHGEDILLRAIAAGAWQFFYLG